LQGTQNRHSTSTRSLLFKGANVATTLKDAYRARSYFIGYAIWNYLTAPFIFARDGFTVCELDGITENGEDLRVLEVHYPPDIPAHTAVQKYYFDKTGLLKRLDYTTDVLGGVAAHYTFDQKNVDGLIIPQLRRVVRRDDDGPHVFGPTSFVLDYTSVEIEDLATAAIRCAPPRATLK
jgi:hypothetical protein